MPTKTSHKALFTPAELRALQQGRSEDALKMLPRQAPTAGGPSNGWKAFAVAAEAVAKSIEAIRRDPAPADKAARAAQLKRLQGAQDALALLQKAITEQIEEARDKAFWNRG